MAMHASGCVTMMTLNIFIQSAMRNVKDLGGVGMLAPSCVMSHVVGARWRFGKL